MADIQLTAQQRGAVEDRGGSLLVSAAAGSGKTKVLVERVFAYLTEEHCHIDDFLIITFTRAAAAELRTKLAAELAKRVAQDPENSHLRQQMFRVYQADIKTVDGFCAGLLREHIHLLEPVDGRSLTPDFRILDETEAGVLKQRALEDALEAFYQRIEQGTKAAGRWRRRWASAGMTGRWRRWCRSCTENCRAIPTRTSGWRRLRRTGRTCRNGWATACTAGRSWKTRCAAPITGRGGWNAP